MKTIEVIVAPSGSISVETKGFAGFACKQASLFLESTLGCSSGEQLTSEFYCQAQQQHSAQASGLAANGGLDMRKA